jgi:hypothetical protein
MARKPSSRVAFLTMFVVLTLTQTLYAGAGAPDPCNGGQVVNLPNGTIGCTHGPDPVPIGAPATDWRLMQPAATPTVTCVDDGQSGSRVQAVYVVASDRPNRSAEVVPQIRRWIADVDSIFSGSSAPAGVDMTVRWVHDQNCVVDVATVVVPPNGDDTFFDTIEALDAAGYGEAGRHYLAWVDASEYCGIAVNYADDSVGPENWNNGGQPLWARVDRECWGRDGLVEAHELTHMLGSVQPSAPNATPFGHCTDEYDIMCYQDGPGVTMEYACPDPAHELLLDCNNDDYFNVDPPPGSYLDTHWNVARSSFLHTAPPSGNPVDPPANGSGEFGDIAISNPFRGDVDWLADRGITRGCNPPGNDRFCPDDPVTRGQMAAFLVRALDVGVGDGGNPFRDDDGTVFEPDIERLAAAGITSGCGPDTFCPNEPITRGQMAAFLTRALELDPAGGDTFTDDDDSPFEEEIERLAAAGITTGCGPGTFCPDDPVTRAQMAAFLRRALG